MTRLLSIFLVIYLSFVSCTPQPALPIVSLETKEVLSFDKKQPIQLHQEINTTTFTVQGTAKWRGGWSRQFDKKSFSIDTAYPIALAGMNPHTKWILNASYIDKTLIRHRFWYEIWRAMDSAHEAAVCRYINLIVDGKDQGIYVAMERIHESRLGISPEGVLFKDPQVFRKDTIPAEKEDSYFHQKYPDPEVENRDSQLFNFRNFLMTSDSSTFTNQVTRWIDIEHIIDWHLLLLLSHNGDGLLKNFYLYKKTDADPIKIIPWDYDHSAGRDGDNELNLRNTFIDHERNILLDRLMQINAQGYNNKTCARWWNLRNSNIFTPESLYNRIDKLALELKSSIDNNFIIWPYDGPGYYDDNNHTEEVELLKEYLDNRIKFLDDYFDCKNIN